MSVQRTKLYNKFVMTREDLMAQISQHHVTHVLLSSFLTNSLKTAKCQVFSLSVTVMTFYNNLDWKIYILKDEKKQSIYIKVTHTRFSSFRM